MKKIERLPDTKFREPEGMEERFLKTFQEKLSNAKGDYPLGVVKEFAVMMDMIFRWVLLLEALMEKVDEIIDRVNELSPQTKLPRRVI